MNKYDLGKSRRYNNALKQKLCGGVHYNFRTFGKESPRHMVKGSKSRLWDLDGNEYLDLYGKFGASIVGHGNEEYAEKLKEQISRALSINHSDLDLEASSAVLDCFPGMDRIRFGLSGTEIVQNAIRLARAYTKKQKIIRFNGHYHGNSDNIMGGMPRSDCDFHPVEFTGDSHSTLGRAAGILEEQSFLLPWNDAALLEGLLVKEHQSIAAIIMEPICINGGGIYPKPGYLERVRELCDRFRVLLIFDEIITGFRLCLGGAQKLLGVLPDITTLGKAMAGGGVPVSAMVGKQDIMALFDEQSVVHAGTFNGYVLGLAAIVATLRTLKERGEQAYSSMARISDRIADEMGKAARDVGLEMSFQGPKTALSFHCQSKELASSEEITGDLMLKDSIVNRSFADFGVLISPVSRMYLNIMMDDSDIGFFKERASDALDDANNIIKSIIT